MTNRPQTGWLRPIGLLAVALAAGLLLAGNAEQAEATGVIRRGGGKPCTTCWNNYAADVADCEERYDFELDPRQYDRCIARAQQRQQQCLSNCTGLGGFGG